MLNSCISDLSSDGSNTIIKERSNYTPDKKAILFLREAGATVANSYQISVINNKDLFDSLGVGNTFVADNNHNEIIIDSNSINLKWQANDTLVVDYDKNLRIFKMEKNVLGVTILFQAR